MTQHNQNYIPVLTGNGRPLAPCHPNRAQSLVKTGKAQFQYRRGIRCIILNRTNIPKVKTSSRLNLRIDPGSRTTGIAITRSYGPGDRDYANGSRASLIGIEIHHQGKAITERLIKRRQRRWNRRYRKTRYRKPRFQNRTKPDGWLPPSIHSRLQNTLTWVNRLNRLLPIQDIHVETTTFDPQLLRDPDIKGTEYQQGPLYQTNLRTAVRLRDQNRCVYCGRKGKRLELDHATPKSQGGPDRYDNLVASCSTCNRKKSNQSLETFLKRRPARLREIQEKLGQDLTDTAHMNIIIPELIRDLHAQGWKVYQHAAATTAAGRRVCGIEKSHHGDAAVTGCPNGLNYIPDSPITIQAAGRGNRQRIVPNQFGTPRGDKFRKYSRLPREIQRVTPTPSHKKRPKRVDNIATGDYVTFIHHGRGKTFSRKGTTVHGYGTISHQQVALLKPKWRSINAGQATILERNHGYKVAYPRPLTGNAK